MDIETAKPGHWPYFSTTLCSTMTDRERLGLPEKWIPSRWADEFARYYEQIRKLEVDELLQRTEDTRATLPERIVAGNLLALIGDPRINTLNPAMVHINAGTVSVGLPFEEVDRVMEDSEGLGMDRKWIEKECPRHQVHLKPYALSLYPVTNQEYRDFLADTQLDMIPSSWIYRRYPQELANHPVYTVSAEMADAYCAWLREKTGRPYRLPTESEWEYAAAGPEGYEFPWGNAFLYDRCNTAELGLFHSTPVGVFVEGRSPFGLSDMAGNVEEYTANLYEAYPGGVRVSDHLTEIHGTYRIARGGAFVRFRDLARTRRRHGYNPRSTVYAMGFRLACDLT